MALSEAPIIALALIRDFEEQAFSVAVERAEEACFDGKFATAYEWRRIAEIIRDETESDLVEDQAAAAAQPTAHHRKHWIRSLIRWIEAHSLLAQPISWGWDPFGPHLEPWKVMGLAEDAEMIHLPRSADGYAHLLDDVDLPSTACPSCAGHLVCAEVRHTLADRAQRLRLEERLAQHPHHHDDSPGAMQPVDLSLAAPSSDESPDLSGASAASEPRDTHSEPDRHLISPVEADIREALIKCWMRKSGLMHERMQANLKSGTATP